MVGCLGKEGRRRLLKCREREVARIRGLREGGRERLRKMEEYVQKEMYSNSNFRHGTVLTCKIWPWK